MGTALSRSSAGNYHWHVQAPVVKVETSLWTVEGTEGRSEATECLDHAKERNHHSKSQTISNEAGLMAPVFDEVSAPTWGQVFSVMDLFVQS